MIHCVFGEVMSVTSIGQEIEKKISSKDVEIGSATSILQEEETPLIDIFLFVT